MPAGSTRTIIYNEAEQIVAACRYPLENKARQLHAQNQLPVLNHYDNIWKTYQYLVPGWGFRAAENLEESF